MLSTPVLKDSKAPLLISVTTLRKMRAIIDFGRAWALLPSLSTSRWHRLIKAPSGHLLLLRFDFSKRYPDDDHMERINDTLGTTTTKQNEFSEAEALPAQPARQLPADVSVARPSDEKIDEKTEDNVPALPEAMRIAELRRLARFARGPGAPLDPTSPVFAVCASHSWNRCRLHQLSDSLLSKTISNATSRASRFKPS